MICMLVRLFLSVLHVLWCCLFIDFLRSFAMHLFSYLVRPLFSFLLFLYLYRYLFIYLYVVGCVFMCFFIYVCI